MKELFFFNQQGLYTSTDFSIREDFNFLFVNYRQIYVEISNFIRQSNFSVAW